MEERGRKASSEPTSFLLFTVCHRYRMHYWLFILVRRTHSSTLKHRSRSERLNRQIKYYDRQMHGNFVGSVSALWIYSSFPRSSIAPLLSQTIQRAHPINSAGELTFQFKKIFVLIIGLLSCSNLNRYTHSGKQSP